jgi:hypothetical protein
MPEGVGGDPANQHEQNIEAQNILAEGQTEYTAAVACFDLARTNWHEACTEYALSPDRDHTSDLAACSGLLVQSFANTIKQIGAADSSTEEKVATIANLLYDEDETRTATFRQLTHCSGFVSLDTNEAGESRRDSEESLKATLQQLIVDAESPEAFYESIIGSYADGFSQEMDHLLAHIPPDMAEEPTLVERMGEAAVDIAKIAAGAVLAGVILDRIRRRA